MTEAAAIEAPGAAAAQQAGAHPSRSRLLKGLPWVLGAVLFWLLYWNLGPRGHAVDSDTATLLLQGQSITHGHLLLHGWNLQYDSFWTIEVPFYALGVALFGIWHGLLFLVPAVLLALLLITAGRLAVEGRQGWRRAVPLVIVIAILGLPSNEMALLVTRAGWHIGTILFCLVAFAAVRSNRYGAGWAVAVVLVALAMNGDLQAIPLGAAPLVGGGLLAMLRTRSWRGGMPTFAAGVASVVLGYGLREIAKAIGSYHIGKGNPHAKSDQVSWNVKHLPTWLSQASGDGRSLWFSVDRVPDWLSRLHALTAVAIVIAVIAALVSLGRAVIRPVRTEPGQAEATKPRFDAWRLDDILLLACLADMVFFCYAVLAPNNPGYLRYLTPAVVFGAVLVARLGGRLFDRAKAGWLRAALAVLLTFVTVCYAVAFGIDSTQPRYTNNGYARLVSFLEQHKLTNGVGSYWVAASSTVVSGDKVHIRPIIGTPTHRIVRYDKQSTADWYQAPFYFMVFEDKTTWPGVNLAAADNSFGTPSQTYEVSGFTVLVWDHGFRMSPTEVAG